MTIGWAIIIIAILYLLDKHHLLKKALKVAAIPLAIALVTFGSFIGWLLLKESWGNHQFANTHEYASRSTSPPGQPTTFGNASCKGQRQMGLHWFPTSQLAPRILPPAILPADFFNAKSKYCLLISGDPQFKGTSDISLNSPLSSTAIRDRERLNIMGKSKRFEGSYRSGIWYKVLTQDGQVGYVTDLQTKCDGEPPSCPWNVVD